MQCRDQQRCLGHVLRLKHDRALRVRGDHGPPVKDRSVHLARADHTGAYPARPVLQMGGQAEGTRSVLANAIAGPGQDRGAHACGRRNRDHHAVATLSHAGQDRAEQVEGSADVDLHDGVEVLAAELVEGAPRHVGAGVVHEDVHLRQALPCPGDHGVHRFGVAHIERVRVQPAGRPAGCVAGRLQLGQGAPDRDDLRALFGVAASHRLSYAAPRTGYDRALAVKPHGPIRTRP